MTGNPMPWSITPRPHPIRAGTNCWTIVLPDTREATCYADRITVEHGTLHLWALAGPYIWDPPAHQGDNRQHRDQPELLLAVAAGSWLCCYATNSFTGGPLAVEHVPDPNIHPSPDGQQQ